MRPGAPCGARATAETSLEIGEQIKIVKNKVGKNGYIKEIAENSS